jgi:hypothetical protein
VGPQRAHRRNGRADQEDHDRRLARKLLVALWRYVNDGVVPDGAKLKAA